MYCYFGTVLALIIGEKAAAFKYLRGVRSNEKIYSKFCNDGNDRGDDPVNDNHRKRSEALYPYLYGQRTDIRHADK